MRESYRIAPCNDTLDSLDCNWCRDVYTPLSITSRSREAWKPHITVSSGYENRQWVKYNGVKAFGTTTEQVTQTIKKISKDRDCACFSLQFSLKPLKWNAHTIFEAHDLVCLAVAFMQHMTVGSNEKRYPLNRMTMFTRQTWPSHIAIGAQWPTVSGLLMILPKKLPKFDMDTIFWIVVLLFLFRLVTKDTFPSSYNRSLSSPLDRRS